MGDIGVRVVLYACLMMTVCLNFKLKIKLKLPKINCSITRADSWGIKGPRFVQLNQRCDWFLGTFSFNKHGLTFWPIGLHHDTDMSDATIANRSLWRAYGYHTACTYTNKTQLRFCGPCNWSLQALRSRGTVPWSPQEDKWQQPCQTSLLQTLTQLQHAHWLLCFSLGLHQVGVVLLPGEELPCTSEPITGKAHVVHVVHSLPCEVFWILDNRQA